MGKIYLPQDQQEDIRRRFPKPAYSRITGFTIALPDDGNWRYNYTDVIGDRVWLLNVKVYVLPKAVDVTKAVAFVMLVGSGKPTNVNDMHAWDRIAPCRSEQGAQLVWTIHDGRHEMYFDMMRFFRGRHIRFGIMAWRTAAAGIDGIWAQFTISEG